MLNDLQVKIENFAHDEECFLKTLEIRQSEAYLILALIAREYELDCLLMEYVNENEALKEQLNEVKRLW